MTDIFTAMENADASRVQIIRDAASGLRAIIALDSMALGPAMGGIRTRAYPSFDAALADAQRLASAMTLKCAIAGLPAGGAKTVVIDHPGLDRPAAFRKLGEMIEDLGGRYLAAGDLGTTVEDLENVAHSTSHVETASQTLGAATGATVVNCMRAAAAARGHASLAGLKVAVQGCGVIGGGVARLLAHQGVELFIADTNAALAGELATELSATVLAPDAILSADVDIVSPCAVGGILTESVANDIKAWLICGGANNQCADPSVALALSEKDIVLVPDFLASSGAVIHGACERLGGLDADALIDRVGETTAEILRRSEASGAPPIAIATQMARERVAAGRTRPRRDT